MLYKINAIVERQKKKGQEEGRSHKDCLGVVSNKRAGVKKLQAARITIKIGMFVCAIAGEYITKAL